MSAHDLFARVSGHPLSPEGAAIASLAPWRPLLATGDGAPRRWPASPSYLRHAMRRPWLARPGRLVAALLPEGTLGHAPPATAASAIGERDEHRWPERPLWITSVQLDTGARVVFGRGTAPVVDVQTAVRCSSAVPGLRPPVRVGEARYVDGGIASPTHLDLLAESAHAAPGVVVVASPLSRFAPLRLLLRLEMRRLSRRGIRVAVFEPCADVALAMGWNPMDPSVAPHVAEVAYRGALRRLQSHGAPWLPLNPALPSLRGSNRGADDPRVRSE